MFLVSADANTSASAPWVSWVTRSDEPAKENSTAAPGFSALNCSPMSVKLCFSDAAAKTMIFALAAVGLSFELHPLIRIKHSAAITSRFKTALQEFRRSRWWP
jgi:hypothetical protein